VKWETKESENNRGERERKELINIYIVYNITKRTFGSVVEVCICCKEVEVSSLITYQTMLEF
jgi:hypothetical protein